MRPDSLNFNDTFNNEEELQSFLDYCNEALGMKIVLHHKATDVGYESNKIYGRAESYKGRFGNGIKIRRNNPNSNRYCIIEYWTEVE